MKSKNKKLNRTIIAAVMFAMIVFSFGIFNAQSASSNKKVNGDFELDVLAAQGDYMPGKNIEMDFQFDKKRKIFASFKSWIINIFTDEYKDIKISAKLIDSQGRTMDHVEPLVNYTKDGEFKISLVEPDKQGLKPGKYSLKIAVNDEDITQGEEIVFTQDFTWGVLAFNVNKSILSPGEEAYLQMAVLDDEGHTICDAELELKITNDELGIDETLSTADGTIIRNPECGPDNIIDTPDYFGYYQVGGVGTYEVELIAITENGVREITDQFEVRESQAFEVERIGPTRIYPKADYEMKIKIKANKYFKGDINEFIPSGFVVNNNIIKVLNQTTEELEIRNWEFEINQLKNNTKSLSWKGVELNAGDELEISYSFDAPNVSPEFYLLGPLRLVDTHLGQDLFEENRQWQIASDATIEFYVARRVAQETKNSAGWSAVTGTAESGTTGSTNGWIDNSNFTEGDRYLIMVWGSHNIANNNERSGIRVTHGGTEFPQSETVEETDRTNAAYKTPYYWHTLWTAADEDIEVEYYSSSSTIDSRVEDITLLIMNAEDLIQNGDLYYATSTNPSGSDLSTSFVSKLNLAWTPDNNGDDWWISGYTRMERLSGKRQYEARLNIDSGTIRSTQSIEGERAGDTPVYGLGWVQDFDDTSHTVDIEIREEAADQGWYGAGVFALRLNAFQNYAYATSSGPFNLTTDDQYETLLTNPYTPNQSGYSLVTGGYMGDDNNGRITGRIQESASNLTDEYGGWQHDPTDIRPWTGADIKSYPANLQNLNMDARETNNIAAQTNDMWLLAFSMAQKEPPTATFNSATQKSDGSGAVDISMEVNDGDWDDCRVQVEYVSGAACDFGGTVYQATLYTDDARTTADDGDPDVDNNETYQIGTTTAPIPTSAVSNTVNFDWDTATDLPSASGETYCLRLTANDFTSDQTNPATTTVVVDNTSPTITGIYFPDEMYAVGDTLTATITVSSETVTFLQATSSINEATSSTDNLNKISDTTYTIDYIVEEGHIDRASGTIPAHIQLKDAYGNLSNIFTNVTSNDASIDANSPNITSVTTEDLMYGIGDTITATITVTADPSIFLLATSSINEATSTTNNFQKINDTTYTLDYTIQEGDNNHGTGTIPFHIVLVDFYGNEASPYIGLLTEGSIDSVKPIINNVFITNGEYFIDSEVSVLIDADGTGYSESAITVNGKSITNFTDNGDDTYSVTYTVEEGDTDRAAGTIPVSIILSNKYGNESDEASSAVGNLASVDANKPIIAAVDFPDLSFKIGDTLTATITVASDSDTYYLATSSINEATSTTDNLTKINDTTYTLDYTVSQGDDDRTVGTIPVHIVLKDDETKGNISIPATTTQANSALIDANPPVIESVNFTPSSGVLIVGEYATSTITASSLEENCTVGSVMDINGVDVRSTFSEIGGGDYQLVYEVLEGHTDRSDAEGLPVYYKIYDAAGNESEVYGYADSDNRPGVDANTPQIDNVVFTPSSGVLKVGDIATATIYAMDSEIGLASGTTMTINSIDVRDSFFDNGDGTYTVTYTVTEGQNDINDISTSVPIYLTIQDDAGNLSNASTSIPINESPGVDANTPQINNVVFEPVSGTLIVGDIATATIYALNDETGLASGTTMTINSIDVRDSFYDNNDGTYTVTYTVQESETDIDDTTESIPINLTIQDSAGNLSNASTSIPIDESPGIDANTPGITAVTFDPNSGVIKVGDIATATIVSTDFETSLSSGTTMTINGVPVGTTFQESGAGYYTVTYTVNEGDTDIEDSANLPIEMTLKDPAGNQTTIYNTSDINGRPGVDANTPSDPGPLTYNSKDNTTITLNLGSTSSEDNFDQYKIFYKIGSGSVTENDFVWDRNDDVNLDDRLFNGYSTTTITGLTPGTQYTFNIWAYDNAGNKASGSPVLTRFTDYVPQDPTSLNQYKSDGVTAISSGGWTNDDGFVLEASVLDSDISEVLTLYFEIATHTDAFTEDISSACSYNASWDSCSSKVWATTSIAGDWSATPFAGRIESTGLPDSNTGYKWQVKACDDEGVCSDWSVFNIDAISTVLTQNIPIDSGTIDTVAWKTIVTASSTEFTGGDKYLIYVTAGFAGSTITVDTDFQILYNSTVQYTGLVEGPGDAYDAHQISWFDVYDQPVSPEDISIRYRTNSGASYALNAQILAINLSDLDSTDWKYASSTAQGEHTDSMSTTTSLTLDSADGLKDWLIMAMEEVQIDDDTINFESEIYSGGSSYMEYSREGEDTNELIPYTLFAPFDDVATNTDFALRVRDEQDIADNNNNLRNRIFALNLNAFHSHKTYYADFNTSLDSTWTEVGNLNSGGNYEPLSAGEQLIFTSFINKVNNASAGTDDRLQVNGTTSPVSWSWTQSPVPDRTAYDSDDLIAQNIITKTSIPATGYSINLDAIEINGTNQVATSVSMTAFNTIKTNLGFKVDYTAPTQPGSLTVANQTNDTITLEFGDTATEVNFKEYKIFYKIGTSGVTEGDQLWGSSSDANLGDILFNGESTTTISGLATGTQYVFNIWVYDELGNKASATSELVAGTNFAPLTPEDLVQKENDNVTVVGNGEWAIDQTMLLSASSSDPEGQFFDYYFEVLPVASSSETATTVPQNACHTGDSFDDCTGKVWKYSTGPNWYNTSWLYRKQISIDADVVESNLTDFPILASSFDEDLKREARSDGHDIFFTAADGVTPLNFERKLWDPNTGQLIAWIKTDLSSTTDNFIYMYYGNSSYSTDNSTTTGVWDTSYLGVWHMDEIPTGSTDDIKDSSGNNRHMTSYGSMATSSRIVTDTGYAYDFDGSGDYLEDDDGENYINGLSAFTVEIWLKSDLIDTDRGFINGEIPDGGDNVFTLRYDTAGYYGGGDDVLKGAITTDVDGETQMESSEYLQTTDWQHIVFRWESGSQFELFVDGTQATTTWLDPARTGSTTGADRLRIGQGGKDGGTTGWDGIIDEVRISNVYRDDAFIKTAYNNQSNLASFASFGAQDSVRIYNIPESSTGYKWQVMVCDIYDLCTDWVPYNASTPNFKVDNTAPTTPGDLSEDSHGSVYAILNINNSTTTESFLDEYRIYYKVYDGTPVSTSDNLFDSSDDPNLGDILFNGAATTTINNLSAGTQYEFNIWAFDFSGQNASATPITITTNSATNRPTGSFASTMIRRDGTGVVDISIEVDDPDNDDTCKARIEYATGTVCTFTGNNAPTLDETGANITADYGDPDIDNSYSYQVGTSTSWIWTSPGSNTVNFDWLSANNLEGYDGYYCLQLTVNDDTFDQVTPATTTIYIDDKDPTSPGALTLDSKASSSLTLDLGASTIETNFKEYKIYYKVNDGSVPTESDSVHASNTDANLGFKDYNSAETTTISGLEPETTYTFAIWVYDEYGNRASSTTFNATTNINPNEPISLGQNKLNGLTVVNNGAWTTENTVKMHASATDNDTSEIITLYFELITEIDDFTTATTVPVNPCASTTSYSSCTSKFWYASSSPGDYSSTAFTATITPATINNSSLGYKWQAMACDDDGVCSEWTQYNASTPNFKVDYTPPTNPGPLSVISYTSTTTTLYLGSTSIEENFVEYKIFYKKGSGGITESDQEWASTSDENLGNKFFNSATTTTITGLDPSSEYYFNIWAYDEAGNKASGTVETSTTTNTLPNGEIIKALQKQDGTGRVDIEIDVDDLDNNSSRAKIEYVQGATCDFSGTVYSATLDETDVNATSTYGDPKVENDNDYQIGNASGWIETWNGTNTVYFDWLSKTDLSDGDDIYCLRLTVSDNIQDQAIFATSTVLIDNKAPDTPGALTLYSKTGTSIILEYGATSSDTHFDRYRIYYGEGAGTVDEGNKEHYDSNLLDVEFLGNSTTTIEDLKINTQYSFKIYAYDTFGNKAESSQNTYTTNAPPTAVFKSATTKQKDDGTGVVDIAIEVYDLNGDECMAKIEYATGSACVFTGSNEDPTLDETDANITANHGDPDIDNNSIYQVGTSTRIVTNTGSTTVNFDWLSYQDVPSATSSYCLRLTANDGVSNQVGTSTIVITVDNVDPLPPGDLTVEYVSGIYATLAFGAEAIDTNFKEYKIFYTEGTSGVTENDHEFNRFNDSNLGNIDYGGMGSTTITELTQNTDYVFNIWVYDNYGHVASATTEVSTTTLLVPSATMRENEDTSDPTEGTYLGKGENVRVRIAVINAGDWAVSNKYRLEYGIKGDYCSTTAEWIPVMDTYTTEHWQMVDSSYYDTGDPTTEQLTKPLTYNWIAGEMVEGPATTTGYINLSTLGYSEIEYDIQATASSTSGSTYCFRVTQSDGTELHEYIEYPELTLAPPPTGAFNSVIQKTDNTYAVDISIEVEDLNGDLSQAKLEYATGTTCDFSDPGDPTLDETDENITADFGDPVIDNGYPYQIGTTSGYIVTQNGSNTVDFDWLTTSDFTDTESYYCLRLTANDGIEDQFTPATTTVLVDQIKPTDPGDIFLVSKTSDSVTIGFGSSSEDTFFREYIIYYKKGSSGVTESDNQWASSSDINLAADDWNTATNTKISKGLEINNVYYFRMWAYDQAGNKASTSNELYVSLKYRSKSENWRWYHDQANETPLTPAADEEYAPTDIVDGSIMKLRLALQEVEDVTGSNAKIRLQYSTYNDFSDNVYFVGEIGSTTLWTYGDGVDDDDDPISTALLSGITNGATHNESGISTSTYDHIASTSAEWEFTIRSNGAEEATTYYFRAFDNNNNEPIEVNDGFNYPSLMIEAGDITFGISGFEAGSTTENITADITSTANQINFGTLQPGNDVVGVHRFTVDTNSGGGYQLYVYQRQNLISNGGADINPATSTNENPSAWPITPSPSAFGYHTSDDTLAGTLPARFAPDNSYAKFEETMKEVAYSPIPVDNEIIDMIYRVEVSQLQEAGDYETEIVYILMPLFYE